MGRQISRTAVCCCVHDDHEFLTEALRSFEDAGPCYVFVSRLSWNDDEGDWKRAADLARLAGATVVEGEWCSEAAHRAGALAHLSLQGHEFALIPDGDEIIEPRLLAAVILSLESGLCDRVTVEWDTYWKSGEFVIRPRERFCPLIGLRLDTAKHVLLREFKGGRHLHLGAEHGIIHHLSYAGSDSRIERKVTTWGHKDEVDPDWLSAVWRKWDEAPLMTDLHPTHPAAYRRAVRIDRPKILGGIDFDRPWLLRTQPEPADAWPKVSAVVPVYGGEEELVACLEGLESCSDLLHEAIVVDNASPDNCADIAECFEVADVIRSDENLGFGAGSNLGALSATGDVVLFLNSDAVLTRAGLIETIESLMAEEMAGAAGPLTNAAGHGQVIEPGFDSLEEMPLFAETLAFAGRKVRESDMAVGFCLAVKQSVLDDVGLFDEAFGLGWFEDNDLCYRIRRSGRKVLVVESAYVHHFGSKTFARIEQNHRERFKKNEQIYFDKWARDLETCFATHLSGTSTTPITFDERRKPELLLERISSLREKANISLCMIAKNEERVIRECLTSAAPFFNQMIVVDTGSTDRTAAIAEECGAEVHHIEWPDSFAEARNESLKHAKGDWIFWLDCDDTLPWSSGEAIVHAATQAGDEIKAFVVPVQFVEDGPGGGTRVDHVKLIRNLEGISFEGRIHEQVLGSIRRHKGEVVRLDAVVLHSGYDTSEDGQARKRERDEKLLALDLAERPDHPFVHFNIGMTAHYTGDQKRAVRHLRESIELAGPSESHVRKAYALMAMAYRQSSDLTSAKEAISEGLLAVGDDPELQFHLASIYTDQGDWEKGLEHYRLVEQEGSDDHFSSRDIGIFGFKRMHNMGLCLAQLGRKGEAIEAFRKATTLSPQHLPSAFAMFDAAIDAQDYQSALEAADITERAKGRSEGWVEMKIRLLEQVCQGEDLIAALHSLEQRSCAAALRVAKELAELGDIENAEARFQAWAGRGSAEAAYCMGVSRIQQGDYVSAKRWMKRALELNPGHADTEQQIKGLARLIEEQQKSA